MDETPEPKPECKPRRKTSLEEEARILSIGRAEAMQYVHDTLNIPSETTVHEFAQELDGLRNNLDDAMNDAENAEAKFKITLLGMAVMIIFGAVVSVLWWMSACLYVVIDCAKFY